MTDIETSIRHRIFCDVIRVISGHEMDSGLYVRLLETIHDGPQAPASLPRQQIQTAKVIPFPQAAVRTRTGRAMEGK